MAFPRTIITDENAHMGGEAFAVHRLEARQLSSDFHLAQNEYIRVLRTRDNFQVAEASIRKQEIEADWGRAEAAMWESWKGPGKLDVFNVDGKDLLGYYHDDSMGAAFRK